MRCSSVALRAFLQGPLSVLLAGDVAGKAHHTRFTTEIHHDQRDDHVTFLAGLGPQAYFAALHQTPFLQLAGDPLAVSPVNSQPDFFGRPTDHLSPEVAALM